MSMVKSLGDLFVSYPVLDKVSLYTKVYIPLFISIAALYSTFYPCGGVLFTIVGFATVIAALYLAKALRRSLRALTLPFMFMAVGLAFNIFSRVLGLEPPPIREMVLTSFKVALIFVSLALLIQWTSLRELRYILCRIGLGGLASMLSIVFTVMPILLNMYSEAYTATLLKYGRKRVYKAVKPLIIQASILARDIAQALQIYGLPKSVYLEIRKPSALEIAIITALTVAGVALIIYAP